MWNIFNNYIILREKMLIHKTTRRTKDMSSASAIGKMLNDFAGVMGKKVKEKVKNKFIYNENIEVRLCDVKDKIIDLADYMDGRGFEVIIYEDIDARDVSNTNKFFIKIEDINGTYVIIDLADYRAVVLDFSQSERDYINDFVERLRGFNKKDNEEIADKICEYLQYLFYFTELQTKQYENIGWDKYNGEWIFKYNRIYPNNILAECNSEIGDVLICEDVDSKIVDWAIKTTKLLNQSKMANLILASACTGLVRQLLPYTKENNININIVGLPASGKSTIGHFALSLFGRPSVLEGSFVDKPDAIEINRVKRPIIPYILDERMMSFEGRNINQELKMSIFREYEGKVKERAGGTNRKISGQRTYAPFISSSVESLLERLINEQDVGQFRRFMEFEVVGLEKKNSISADEYNNKMIFTGASDADIYEELADSSYGIGLCIIMESLFEGEKVDLSKIQTNGDDYKILFNRIINEYESKNVDVDKKMITTYNEICEKIDKILGDIEKDKNLYGLKSSTKRFALIITAYRMLRDALNGYWDIIMADQYAEPPIKDQEKDLMDLLVDNLCGKIKRVEIRNNHVDNIVRFIKRNKDLFIDSDDNWMGIGDYIGEVKESEDKIEITCVIAKYTIYIVKAIMDNKIVDANKVREYFEAVKDNNCKYDDIKKRKEKNRKSLKEILNIEVAGEKISKKDFVYTDVQLEDYKYTNDTTCKKLIISITPQTMILRDKYADNVRNDEEEKL